MRTTVEENEALGKKLAEKVNQSIGPCTVMLPLKGVSMIDAEGQPFYGPDEDEALFNALRSDIDQDRATLTEIDAHINDDEFAKAAVDELIKLMEQ